MELKKILSEAYDQIKIEIRALLSPIRRRKIEDTSFTIISNNCWGGLVYQRYGVPYATPTVGLYFFAEDYIRMLQNLKYYMSIPMTIISVEESKHKEVILKRHQEMYPIGRIDDVEIVFRHYKTAEEAIEKWERRKQRINYDNLIVKFSEMNLCSEEHIRKFLALPYKTKFAFVNRAEKVIDKSLVYQKGYESLEHILDDTKYYSRYINIKELINKHIIDPQNTKVFD